jgi:hypothetical protein
VTDISLRVPLRIHERNTDKHNNLILETSNRMFDTRGSISQNSIVPDDDETIRRHNISRDFTTDRVSDRQAKTDTHMQLSQKGKDSRTERDSLSEKGDRKGIYAIRNHSMKDRGGIDESVSFEIYLT